MSLLFCNAFRIASVSDWLSTLLLITPTRDKSGSGGNACGCVDGKFGSPGSWVTGWTGDGCGVGPMFTPGGVCGEGCCVAGGIVGGGCCVPGGCVAGLTGVGLGVCAMAVTENARASRPGLSRLVSVRSERFNIEEAPKKFWDLRTDPLD